MQAIVVEQIGAFVLRDVPRPRPAADELLLKVLVTGLCRTDLKLIRQGHRDLLLPRIPGEEVVGEVVGPVPPDSPVQPGQAVFVHPGRWCGQCSACRRGAENLCRAMRIMGFHRDGGFAEFVAAPRQSLIPLPPELPADRAVFAEPLACCLNALELGRCAVADAVGIWGAGTAGQLLARAARALGAASVRLIEPDPNRRQQADILAQPDEHRFDLALCAVGHPDAYAEALLSLQPRGRLVVFSGLPPAAPPPPLSLNQLHYLEQTVVGAYGCSIRHSRQALDLIRTGRVPVDDLISRRLPLADLAVALDHVAHRRGYKNLLYPHPGTPPHAQS